MLSCRCTFRPPLPSPRGFQFLPFSVSTRNTWQLPDHFLVIPFGVLFVAKRHILKKIIMDIFFQGYYLSTLPYCTKKHLFWEKNGEISWWSTQWEANFRLLFWRLDNNNSLIIPILMISLNIIWSSHWVHMIYGFKIWNICYWFNWPDY